MEPWLPLDCPERPFDHGTWIDDCSGCVLALRAEAATRPRLVLCLNTDADRILVTAEYAAEVLTSGRPLEELCYLMGDRISEVFVPVAGRLPPPDRLWSLTAAEEEAAVRVPGGRLPQAHDGPPDAAIIAVSRGIGRSVHRLEADGRSRSGARNSAAPDQTTSTAANLASRRRRRCSPQSASRAPYRSSAIVTNEMNSSRPSTWSL